MSSCDVTVIIPVKDDAARLRTCLEALSVQDFDGTLEVLVVDNGSGDAPEAVVEDFTGVRMLSEPHPSSYAARNTAVRQARGRVLAFTDSDCIPSVMWVRAGHERIVRTQRPTFVAGHVRVFSRPGTEPTPVEQYELLQAFPQKVYVEQYGYGVTANLFVAAENFHFVGFFDHELVSSGDRDWGQRATEAGVTGEYAPDVVVNHPARRSLRDLRRKTERVQIGELQMRTRDREPAWDAAIIRAMLRPPLGRILRDLPGVTPGTLRQRLMFVGVVMVAHYGRLYDRIRLTMPWPRRHE
jgi:glycosyltransferase involved in cell wall biosynthesis